MESTRELSALNQRFSVYLQKIRNLAQINAELHREVEKAFGNFVGQNQSDKYLLLTQLREKITDEVRAQTSIHIRCQRAEYEREFFVDALKTLPAEQKNELKQMDDQLKVRRDELERLQQQCQRKETDVQTSKELYRETLKKLLDLTKQYDQAIFERMDNEHQLCTLKEKISFEQEYHQRRHEELAQLDQIQQDLIQQFQLNEYEQIIERIRLNFSLSSFPPIDRRVSSSSEKIIASSTPFGRANWKISIERNSINFVKVSRRKKWRSRAISSALSTRVRRNTEV